MDQINCVGAIGSAGYLITFDSEQIDEKIQNSPIVIDN